MVHKKYIIKKGKKFGPYLYENYRENGKTKTRYLGKYKEKKNLLKNPLFVVGIFVLLAIMFIGFTYLSYNSEIKFEKMLADLSSVSFKASVDVVGQFPPEIIIAEDIFVCENEDLDYDFNVSDQNGLDNLYVSLTPLNPFFIDCRDGGYTEILECNLRSSILLKEDILSPSVAREFFSWVLGETIYHELISASGVDGTDYEYFNVHLIEVNNPPKLEEFPLKILEIWDKGANASYYNELNVDDVELSTGIFDSSQFEFSYEFLENTIDFINHNESIFNSELGIINISGHHFNTGFYKIRFCVNDSGLVEHSDNFAFCENGFWDSLSDCSNLSLTIVDRNRAPEIISYSPELMINPLGTELIKYSIVVVDPDENPLNISWYINDELVFEGSSDFVYSFGCEISDNFNVSVFVSDGALNDSLMWDVNVGFAACQGAIRGGGGGNKVACNEKWGCNEWFQCFNLEETSNFGKITKNQYDLIKTRCDLFNYNSQTCGIQFRDCIDLNKCGTLINLTGTFKECYYTENPTCEDGLRNCHDNSCEFLIDCGGPCSPCPSCKDQIKNQREEGIDCGGSCQPCREVPLRNLILNTIVSYVVIAISLLLVILVFVQYKKYKKIKVISKKQKTRKQKTNNFQFSKSAGLVVGVFVLLFIGNLFFMNSIGGGIGGGIPPDELASSGLISTLFSSFSFFATGPFWSEDNLVRTDIGDSSDKGNELYSGDEILFYSYFNNSDGSVIDNVLGNCNVSVEDYQGNNIYEMDYNFSSQRFEYNVSVNYKGVYNYTINCSNGISSVLANETYSIKNTPSIIYQHDTQIDVSEDELYIYDFEQYIVDPDINDDFHYVIESINGDLVIGNYPWFELNGTNGNLTINITNESESGTWILSVGGLDTNNNGLFVDLEVLATSVNDSPQFLNLANQVMSVGDSFNYLVRVSDEEDDPIIELKAEVLSGIFPNFTYDSSLAGKQIFFNFVPGMVDLGEHEINFTVKDSFGNVNNNIVNFTVSIPIWIEDPILNYSFQEDERLTLNLTEQIRGVHQGSVNFNPEEFLENRIDDEGFIDFNLTDIDVGVHNVEIIASSGGLFSSEIFNFNISNKMDLPVLFSMVGDNLNYFDLDEENITSMENINATLYLFIQDNDLLISQKNIYNEQLSVEVNLTGNNLNLIKFIEDETIGNQTMFSANFIPRAENLGNHNLTLNITDNTNNSIFLIFNFTVLENQYDKPIINTPLEDFNFDLNEGQNYNLSFNVTHSVGDDLKYKFYINNSLVDFDNNGFGDGRIFNWSFTPNYTSETYGNIVNLTLVVLNPYVSSLNDSRSWNLTIDHNNSPVRLNGNSIDDFSFPYNSVYFIHLLDYFEDEDVLDENYLQNLSFEINSDDNLSGVIVSNLSENFTFGVSSSKSLVYSETLNLTVYDLEGGNKLTNVTSNNFEINFLNPITEIIQTPSSGSSTTKIISLKLIVPGRVSAFEGDQMIIPLQLVNKGSKDFKDIDLTSGILKEGVMDLGIKTEFDKDFIKELKKGEQENLTLTVFFDKERAGFYELLVNLSSKSPKYTDWAEIIIDLKEINDSTIKELLIFTENLIVENSECLELMELLKGAEESYKDQDYLSAKQKSQEIITACRSSIESVSVPKSNYKEYSLMIYFISGALIALILGILYYLMRKKLKINPQKGFNKQNNFKFRGEDETS
jgi:hypothetical protein